MDSIKDQKTKDPSSESSQAVLNLLEQISRRDERLTWFQVQNGKLSEHLSQEREKYALRQLEVEIETEKNKILYQALIEQKDQELLAIYASRGWRFILFLRRLRERVLPIGSTREKLIKLIVRTPINIALGLNSGIKNLTQNLKKAFNHVRQYGLLSLFKQAAKRLLRASTSTPVRTTLQENMIEIPIEREKARPFLLIPLAVFSVPHSNKRINLVLDTVDQDTASVKIGPIIFALMLAEKWGSQLRIITRLQAATKLEIFHILKDLGITAPDIEFLYIQAGNSKMSLPIGSDEYFILDSWETAQSLLASFQPNKLIYFIQKDERQNYTSEQDKELCNQILMNTPLKFIVEKQSLYQHFVSAGIDNIQKYGAWYQPSTTLDSWEEAFKQILDQFESNQ